MYSVVLMMALTSGGDVPALGHGGSCCGCYGGNYSGCYGGCYGGCSGKHHGRRHGCCGCSGGNYAGCYGGCYGGCSGKHHGRRNRGCGCCGGNYGGCWGGNYGGCWGGCYGGGYGGAIGGVGAPIITTPVNPTPTTTTPATGKQTSIIENAAPATLIVTVPADARLSIDGEMTTSTSTQRTFVTPALEIGREYHYTLEAEFSKDGKFVKMSKEVAVKAGAQTRVTFDADNTADIASR